MILTVARDEALRQRVSGALSGTQWAGPVTEVTGPGEAQQLLTGPTPPRVVIVGRSIGVEGAADIAAVARAGEVTILLVADPTTELLRTAMRAGIRDVLPMDFSGEDLVRALAEAGVRSDGPDILPGVTVSLFSTKGGVGTSVVAANLASRLGERTAAGSTLVDLDLASADQAIMHGLSPKWTIQDLADGGVGLDAESLEQVLLDVPGTATKLLAGPVDPALAETITAAQVAAVVAAVRAISPVAVLDTASGFDDRTLAALDASDRIVVVSSLDVAALRSLTVSLQTMARLGIDEESVLVVVVRSDSKSGLLLADVEHAISRPVDVGIPSTRLVPRSVNEGVPLAISTPRSDVVEAIDEIADRVLEGAPDSLSATGDREDSRSRLFPWSRSGGRGSKPQTRDSTQPIESGEGTGSGQSADSPGATEAQPRGVARDEADAVDDADGEAVVTDLGAEVRSIARPGRRTREQATVGPRRVQRRPAPQPAQDEGVPEEDDPTPETDPRPVRVVDSLEDMPPPRPVADDEDDDRPRRRRRR